MAKILEEAMKLLTREPGALGKFDPGSFYGGIKASGVGKNGDYRMTPQRLQAMAPLMFLGATKGISVYHGTTKTAAESIAKKGFDIKKSADGSIWFTGNKSDLTNSARGVAAPTEAIIKRAIPKNLKLATPDMEDKYLIDQLIQMGYDGVKYPATETSGIWYQIFNPEKLLK